VRDIILTIIVLGSLPICFARPWIGVLVYSWLGYMNPHRLTWGFAYDLPFAQLVALATLAGLVVNLSREKRYFPWCPTIYIWLALLAWMGVTTIFALNPDGAAEGLSKVTKIQLMMFVTLYVMGSKERIHWLVWVIALSIAFYGVKGGVFALLTGGHYRVWGPAGSFIEDNNSLGLALIMTLPLLAFLRTTATRKWVRLGLLGVMGLCAVATLSTQSRGALVGLCVMGLLFWLKSKNKLVLALLLIASAPLAYQFMPASWHSRMQTIETYDQDSSAMGRINAWRFAFQLANQRITGGGIQGIEEEEAYRKYAPELHAELLATGGAFRAAHSIWFGTLGQHGWIGLALFVTLWLMGWRNGSWVIATTRQRPDLAWHNELARMLQVALAGYASTGTFLSMEYFDYYYHVLALLVLVRFLVQRELAEAAVSNDTVVDGQMSAMPSATTPGVAFGRQLPATNRSNG
jgi:probable O-glycosylation ligase (exosortase A-associated)